MKRTVGKMEALLNDLEGHLLLGLLLVLPAWKICGKAGFSPLWSLLVFLPYLGYLALSLVLAFVAWPVAQGRGGD